ncbi:unnamed protein product [Adineta ricciae]|uniref:G domain-containing protein n=1 Tax=Adineta ricciae TaxID=249248 RepID=A0A815VM44_ADIRI|nr:unnamed protein product [Adineta ricciae]
MGTGNSSPAISLNLVGVIMGNTGAGKTTLSNMLCGTNHESGSGRQSKTKQLFENPVNCGSYPFKVVDTPGVDSQVDTFKHAVLLKEALTGTPINTIFFVVKYDSRFDNILLAYLKLLTPVAEYSHKIVVMISHMDLSKNLSNDKKEINNVFKEEYPDKSFNFMFYSEKDNRSEIADIMHSYLSKMPAETLRISDEEFNLNFNIYEMKARIKAAYDKFLRETKQIEDDYTNLIEDLNKSDINTQEKDEILHMSIVNFKNELEALTEQFIGTHGAKMQELDSYGFSIMMQKEKIKLCTEFTTNVSAMMSYSLLDTTDPRNMIKRCPHCQEVWFKVTGCDGSTSCGNRPMNRAYDISEKPFWRFTFVRVGRRIQWQKIEETYARNNSQLQTNNPQSEDIRIVSEHRRAIIQIEQLLEDISTHSVSQSQASREEARDYAERAVLKLRHALEHIETLSEYITTLGVFQRQTSNRERRDDEHLAFRFHPMYMELEELLESITTPDMLQLRADIEEGRGERIKKIAFRLHHILRRFERLLEYTPIHNMSQFESDTKGVGCGKSFVWKDQPPVEEEKIKELFQVKTIEEVKEIIRRSDYRQMRAEYERNIDTRRST